VQPVTLYEYTLQAGAEAAKQRVRVQDGVVELEERLE